MSAADEFTGCNRCATTAAQIEAVLQIVAYYKQSSLDSPPLLESMLQIADLCKAQSDDVQRAVHAVADSAITKVIGEPS